MSGSPSTPPLRTRSSRSSAIRSSASKPIEGVKLLDIGEAPSSTSSLPEEGDFTYVCEVELKPKFELPELEGIEIKAPDIQITDEMVDEQVLRRRKMRGRFELVDTAAEQDDLLVADAVLKVGDEVVKRDENISFGVRPTAFGGGFH